MCAKILKMINQFIKFGIIGVTNTIIAELVTYMIIFGVNFLSCGNTNMHILVLIASFIGFSFGVINSYYWNAKYVFKEAKSSAVKVFIKSYISYGITWLFGYLISVICSYILNFDILIVPIFSIIIKVPLNFFMNKFWAFN